MRLNRLGRWLLGYCPARRLFGYPSQNGPAAVPQRPRSEANRTRESALLHVSIQRSEADAEKARDLPLAKQFRVNNDNRRMHGEFPKDGGARQPADRPASSRITIALYGPFLVQGFHSKVPGRPQRRCSGFSPAPTEFFLRAAERCRPLDLLEAPFAKWPEDRLPRQPLRRKHSNK
jgi:hypothetical protein